MNNEQISDLLDERDEYKYGFTTDIETEYLPKGIDENIVRTISEMRHEPDWLLDFRLRAFRAWSKMKVPTWGHVKLPEIDLKILAGYAVDAVMDSVSVRTTFRKQLAEKGVIFCPISEAVREHPDLVRKYLGTVVPPTDNFFAALNSAVFGDGSFVYIPKGVRCPMELSSYFRINALNTGQFERTLIVAEDDSYVSYLGGGECGGQVLYGAELVPR